MSIDPSGRLMPQAEIHRPEQASLLCGVEVTVVLPCLNEELAVGSCVTSAIEVMRVAGLNGSVLVVDNGSSDNSVNVAIEAGARVVFQPEPGYGAALRSGIEAAQTEFVIMADADGTYELDAIPKLLTPLLSGQADLVLGLRLKDASMPWLHRFVGTPAITYLVKRATNNKLRIRDSQSGFRAFRREQVLNLHLSSTGMEFASEMLIRCAWADLRIHEVNTTYAERVGESKLNTFSDGIRHLRQILVLSPDTVAAIPGVLMTAAAIVLWLMAAQSTHGLERVGSLSWVADFAAGVLSILGPIVFCTGLVLRYRAESLGFRRAHLKVSIGTLIHRFFGYGATLVLVSIVGIAVLIVNFHHHPMALSDAVAASLASFVRSAIVVGIILMSAPLISPFLIRAPQPLLPVAEEESLSSNIEHMVQEATHDVGFTTGPLTFPVILKGERYEAQAQ
jgi:hypothetical protein